MIVILTCRRAETDYECRCGGLIERGRRVVLIEGTGNVHVACVLTPDVRPAPGQDGTTDRGDHP